MRINVNQLEVELGGIKCLGCGNTYAGKAGIRSHQSGRYTAMGCRPIYRIEVEKPTSQSNKAYEDLCKLTDAVDTHLQETEGSWENTQAIAEALVYFDVEPKSHIVLAVQDNASARDMAGKF